MSVATMPDAAALYQSFAAESAPTVGIEEEIMLLDAETLDLLPFAARVVAAAGLAGIGQEMPASTLELRTAPAASVPDAVNALRCLRRRVADAAAGVGLLASAGAHPFSAVDGLLNDQPRYAHTIREYGPIAHRQLVCALQIHVAIRPGPRAVAVYNALRSYLPDLAALAADAPFHGGADTGLASVRPKLVEGLPREGVPPVLPSLDALADEFAWCSRARALVAPGQWWWELRLHPEYGTIEIRVPDAQTALGETAAIAAMAHSLAVWLAKRHDARDLPPPAPTWRIEHNRWSACRHGLNGWMADLATGHQVPTRERIADLLAALAPTAASLGCSAELELAQAMLSAPGAPTVQRQIAAETGLAGLVRWMTGRFLEPLPAGTGDRPLTHHAG